MMVGRKIYPYTALSNLINLQKKFTEESNMALCDECGLPPLYSIIKSLFFSKPPSWARCIIGNTVQPSVFALGPRTSPQRHLLFYLLILQRNFLRCLPTAVRSSKLLFSFMRSRVQNKMDSKQFSVSSISVIATVFIHSLYLEFLTVRTLGQLGREISVFPI